jgi:signal transduction histidine kinase
VIGGERLNTSAFSECVQEYIRLSGYSQKELQEMCYNLLRNALKYTP